jgi:hypothetical protein
MLVLMLIFAASPASASAYQWATGIKWFAGDGTNPGNERYHIEDALGEPEPGRSGYDFLSLGLDGHAILDFGTQFSGLSVFHETTFGSGAGYPEKVRIYGVKNGMLDFAGLAVEPGSDRGVAGSGLLSSALNLGDAGVFEYLGWVDNQSLDGVSALDFGTSIYRYLVIEDFTRDYGSTPSFDGFDLDAAGVTPVLNPGGNPVPVPGAFWLLGSGLMGLMALRARRRR